MEHWVIHFHFRESGPVARSVVTGLFTFFPVHPITSNVLARRDIDDSRALAPVHLSLTSGTPR